MDIAAAGMLWQDKKLSLYSSSNEAFYLINKRQYINTVPDQSREEVDTSTVLIIYNENRLFYDTRLWQSSIEASLKSAVFRFILCIGELL